MPHRRNFLHIAMSQIPSAPTPPASQEPSRRSCPPCPPWPPCSVDELRPELLRLLESGGSLVLSAPPGAGKSSRVPLWLLGAPWLAGRKILLLEPRRVAARALGRYMARLLGEEPGHTVGWRMREESLIGPDTRIEVITEGVLTRLLQADPELPEAACVIFDEFHERSLQADLGLALCLESRAALRPDLRLLVMSATLDVQAVARLLGNCPGLSCAGRSFPVETRRQPLRGMGTPFGPELWRHTAAVILQLLREEPGSLLAFLPGAGEIRQVAALLESRLPPDARLCPLYGNLSAREQDAAIAPARPGTRKVVLATAIAETSLTIEGVRLVVDAGLARSARFDPSCGLSRLVTDRVSLAGAAQRAGRAGRTEPGICCRLWAKEEENGMRPQIRPEILDADLSGLLLQLAVWGTGGPDGVSSLAWLDQPPAAGLAVARQTLCDLGALDDQGRATALGRNMAALPASPRLARLLLHGKERGHGALACCLAALLEERDPLPRAGREGNGETSSDLACRLDWLCRGRDVPEKTRPRRWARRLAGLLNVRQEIFETALADQDALGPLLALAWPEWLAQRLPAPQPGQAGGQAMASFLLRSGRAAQLPVSDALARCEFLAVAAVSGNGSRGRIRLAAQLNRQQLEELFGSQISTEDSVSVSDDGAVLARRRQTLGSLLLRDEPLPRPDAGTCAEALCEFIRQGGPQILARLPWNDEIRQWRARVSLLHELDGDPWPDLSDAALLEHPETWLAPYLMDCAALRRLTSGRLLEALRAQLPYALARRLEQEAPDSWQVPSGAMRPIVYGEEGGPWLAAKLQELFGCEESPRIARGRIALTLRLNSPAGRPLQVTRDLAHFWRNGYQAVRAEMRGRYPKHPWPEDPLTATATALTKKKLAAENKA